MNLLCLLVALFSIWNVSAARQRRCSGFKKYTISVQGSSDYFTGSNPMFSPVAAISHDDMWDLMPTSPTMGLKELAQTGEAGMLIDELLEMMGMGNMMMNAIGHWAWAAAPGTPALDMSPELTLVVDGSHPFLTVVFRMETNVFVAKTMNLCNMGRGQWISLDEAPMMAYTYEMDQVSMKKCVDSADVSCQGMDYPAVAKLSAFPQCEGTQRYAVRYTGEWSSSSHPVNYPGSAHFSPPVGASHSANEYPIFQNGQSASPGLLRVAQTGATSTISDELKSKVRAQEILSMDICETPFDGTEKSEWMHLNVDAENSYISYVTMIAPSPDHITGGRVNMCNKGKWRSFLSMDAYSWDAGAGGSTVMPLMCDSSRYCASGNDIAPFGSLYFENSAAPCGAFPRTSCPAGRCRVRMRRCVSAGRRMMG